MGYWAGTLGGLLKGGWRLGYTDGTGVGGRAAGSAILEDWKRRPDTTYGGYSRASLNASIRSGHF